MHLKHKARLAELPGDGQSLLGAEFAVSEGRFMVDLGADSAATRNPLGLDRPDNPVAGPTGAEVLGSEECVVLVVGVSDVRRRGGDAQGGQRLKPRFETGREASSLGGPSWQSSKSEASKDSLHFGHSPIAADGCVQPFEDGVGIGALNSVPVLAVILKTPCAPPEGHHDW